jgi:acetyltransferase-like isoleucine patch superfamily enzyme
MKTIRFFLGKMLYFFVFSMVVLKRICLFPFKKHTNSMRIIIRQAIWKTKLGYLGKNTNIYPYVLIHDPEAVRIGSNVDIAEFVHIWGGGGVEIGDFSIIASHVVITSLTHDANSPIYRDTIIKKSVKIGKGVWIGAGAIILPGISIGDKAVIGAGSVVTHNVDTNTIVVGVPARTLRQIKTG